MKFLIPEILNYVAVGVLGIGFLVLGFQLRARKPRTATWAVIIGGVHLFNLVAGMLFRLALRHQWLSFPGMSGELDFSVAIYVGIVWALSIPTCLIWLIAGYVLLERPDRPNVTAREHAADDTVR